MSKSMSCSNIAQCLAFTAPNAYGTGPDWNSFVNQLNATGNTTSYLMGLTDQQAQTLFQNFFDTSSKSINMNSNNICNTRKIKIWFKIQTLKVQQCIVNNQNDYSLFPPYTVRSMQQTGICQNNITPVINDSVKKTISNYLFSLVLIIQILFNL